MGRSRTRDLRAICALLIALILALMGCVRHPIGESATIRVAALPILDTLPVYVAAAEGFFAKTGVEVTIVPVSSVAERDQLLQAGQADVAISDLVALMLYNREIHDGQPNVVAIRCAMVATDTFAQFRILAAPGTTIQTPHDLQGVPIGVSEGTIIEYVTWALLTSEGLTPDEIKTIAVPKIPDRMALLNAGELAAATLPEPPASLARQQGARVILDDRLHPDVSGSLYVVRATFREDHPEALQAFMEAIEQAIASINADKTRWDDLLRDQHLLPPPLIGSFELPDYPAPQLPAPEDFNAVADWLQQRGDLPQPPGYSDVMVPTW